MIPVQPVEADVIKRPQVDAGESQFAGILKLFLPRTAAAKDGDHPFDVPGRPPDVQRKPEAESREIRIA